MLARSWDHNSVRLSVCLSVCPSVCLSVTRVLCDETKEYTDKFFTGHERVINLVFTTRLVGDVPFHLKFALEVTHPTLKNAHFDHYLLITSQPQELAKMFNYSE